MGKIKDTDFFSLIHDFFKIYLPSQRKSSPHTIRAYQKALDGLLDYTAAKKIFLWEICLLNALIMRYYLGFLTV